MKIYVGKAAYRVLTSKGFMGVFTFVILGLVMAMASGVVVKNGNIDLGELNATGNVNANAVSALNLSVSGTITGNSMNINRVYMTENGVNGGATNVYFQERPSSSTRRIMMKGIPQSGSFGFIVVPESATAVQTALNLWVSDSDNPSTTGGQKSLGGVILNQDGDRELKISTGKGGSGGVAGDILITPDGVEVLRVKKNGDVVITGNLAVSGNVDIEGCLRVVGQPTIGTCK